MPERSSKKQKQNSSLLDTSIAEEATSKQKKEKNPAAVALGRLGGLRGGPARAQKLTTKQRKQIARKAAEARWQKQE